MKRGTLRKMLHSKKRKPTPDVIIRIATMGRADEPYRVIRINGVRVKDGDKPSVGDTVLAIPTRLQKTMFAHTLTLVSVAERDGIEIYYTEAQS